ncbi:cytochrome c oxidase subunit 4 [Leucobacter massiliensis]|uniref:Cytochrome c oxidase polypeptide 4 n=1 Tax=Leucobacter massiliensis TaxID=1686285 RepID=A0A2S9QNX9_9MICO|nr:cytochrome c oxidase subunit 4 [Leucobacter massiliensis]PRI11301.1 cytochrome c oxidase subunit IV [Leucobacter massiliensis]
MKPTIVIFWFLTAYFIVVSVLYSAWHYAAEGTLELAGSLAILLSGGLAALIAIYLMLVKRKQGGVLVEDRPDSDIDDGDPEIGEFPPHSWWPFTLAGGAALVVLGVCLQGTYWLFFFSLPLVPIAVCGWIYEYYRGNFAR